LPFPVQRAPESFRLGEVEVATRAVPHPAPTLAYKMRFPDGGTLAYVTDTTAPGSYRDFIQGVDVLIHECTFSQQNAEWAGITGHSDTKSVGKLARDAGVGTLYLSHIGPVEDALALTEEVRDEFPNTILPVEGLEYPRETSVDPSRAVFAGSFDPLTVSHLDIVRTCAQMFRSVHVVVARNPAKDRSALFTPSERVELIRRCVPANVSVAEWEGLTVEFARRVQAGCLVRGLGRAEDYFGEIRLWKTNALLSDQVQTVWVPPRAEHLDVSSSMIKEAALFGGWEAVAHLVPEAIRDVVASRIAVVRNAPAA
jgi:pantetheine-phosphate adenylyltransferase